MWLNQLNMNSLFYLPAMTLYHIICATQSHCEYPWGRNAHERLALLSWSPSGGGWKVGKGYVWLLGLSNLILNSFLLTVSLRISQAINLRTQKQPIYTPRWALTAHDFTTHIHLQKECPDYNMPLPSAW